MPRKTNSRHEATGFIPQYDMPILAELPKQGSMIGKFHPQVVTVRILAKRFNDELTADALNGRLRSMQTLGYTKAIKIIPVTQGLGWQITPAGQRMLAAHQEEQNV